MNTIQVYKFGGASISGAAGFKNVAAILRKCRRNGLLVIVSALGKTTNSLEQLALAFYEKRQADCRELFEAIQSLHLGIMHELFPEGMPVYDEIANLFLEIEWVIEDQPHDSFDFIYDQIVPIGELVSSRILAALLQLENLPVHWQDARDFLVSDNTYREACIDVEASNLKIRQGLPKMLETGWVLSQGFIASSTENFSTTLGREGSDYSAALFAAALQAKSLTVWKDVPGIMNADPGVFPAATLLTSLSYSETVELAYYGATVLHPKTIGPLQLAGVPLYVRSFVKPDEPGTCVSATGSAASVPSFIFKKDQMLISLHTANSSFIVESHLIRIFTLFHTFGVKINMMENSALSFSVAVDQGGLTDRITGLLEAAQEFYVIKYNRDLCLITVRNYRCDADAVKQVFEGTEILVESRTRSTLQRLVRF